MENQKTNVILYDPTLRGIMYVQELLQEKNINPQTNDTVQLTWISSFTEEIDKRKIRTVILCDSPEAHNHIEEVYKTLICYHKDIDVVVCLPELPEKQAGLNHYKKVIHYSLHPEKILKGDEINRLICEYLSPTGGHMSAFFYTSFYTRLSGIRSILKPRQKILSFSNASSRKGRNHLPLRTILYLYLSCIL